MKKRELNYCELTIKGERKNGNRKKLEPFTYLYKAPVTGKNLEEVKYLIAKGNDRIIKKIREYFELKPTDKFNIISHKILHSQGLTNYEL
jgi:hypothetical protein